MWLFHIYITSGLRISLILYYSNDASDDIRIWNFFRGSIGRKLIPEGVWEWKCLRDVAFSYKLKKDKLPHFTKYRINL